MTRAWTGNDPATGEDFALRSHSAMDLARFHFVHDVFRLEKWTANRPDTNGFAVLLTNDASLWPPAARSGTRDAAYRLDRGRTVTGPLVWGTPGKPHRRNDRHLRGSYTADWHDYGTEPLPGVGGALWWLGWTITA